MSSLRDIRVQIAALESPPEDYDGDAIFEFSTARDKESERLQVNLVELTVRWMGSDLGPYLFDATELLEAVNRATIFPKDVVIEEDLPPPPSLKLSEEQ